MSLRSAWKAHPLARRLPFLLLAGVGLWLWQGTSGTQRELVWELEGAGWSAVRALEFQVQAPDGDLLKREERFYPQGPERELRLEVQLPAGRYPTLVLARTAPGAPVIPLRVTLEVGDGAYVTQRLRLPAAR